MTARPHVIAETLLPLVAIVGRPNVGKSTLFNRIVGGHNAIVEDQPGVTRDRRYGTTDWSGVSFRVVDTGGLDFTAESSLAQSVQRQSLRAVEEAALLLFLIDGHHGLTGEDREIAAALRKSGKAVIFAANKVDGPKYDDVVNELYALGADNVYGISAAHGRGVAELLEGILETLAEQARARMEAEETADHDLPDGLEQDAPGEGSDEEGESEPAPAGVIRIALIGRPNAGKSSLVNALCGEERMIVDSTPGTTRDPVDTLIEHQGQRYLLIDTAGIRRRAKVYEPMEKIAVAMAEKALNRADVAILVIDGEAGIGEQDAKIAGLVQESGRALIIAFNKRDRLDAAAEKRLQENRARQLQFVPWALSGMVSAQSGRGVLRLLSEARRCFRAYDKRVPTGALNRFFDGIVQKHPPPLFQGKPIRLYYITQAQTKPPTFVLSVNYPEGMHFSYQRYLQNQLREAFGFVGTPVRLISRARVRKE